ncbi:MAG: hypothetical protein ACOC54_03725 [Candidatus Sumerlaeota bacterium]
MRGDPWGTNTLNNPKVTTWIMWSYGPNRMKDLLDISERPNGADWDDYYIVNDYPERIIEFVYDPTNGTKSAGEIFRSGGGSSGVHPEYFSVLQQATSN